MFGCEARIGITSSSLPAEVIATLQSENDLFTTVNGDNIAAQNLPPSTVSADATTDLEPEPVTSTSSAVTSPTDPGHEDDSTVPELVPSISSAVPALASCSFATTYSKHWQSEQLRSENVEKITCHCAPQLLHSRLQAVRGLSNAMELENVRQIAVNATRQK